MERKDVASRLRRFGTGKFGKMAGFASALGITPQALHSTYLTGRSLPGGEMSLKLLIFGVDLNWLFSGHGRPPDPSPEEVDEYLKNLKEQIEYFQMQAEMRQKAEAAFGIAAEPNFTYHPHKRKGK